MPASPNAAQRPRSHRATGRPRGRPKLEPDEETVLLHLAVPEHLYEMVKAHALAHEIPIAEWIRDTLRRRLVKEAARPRAQTG